MLDEETSKLDLSKSYFFQVIYNEEGIGFSATLDLTPKAITFRVTTERPCRLDWHTREVECHDRKNTFLLKGLKCKKSRSATISSHPHVGLFEIEFSVEHLIFIPRQSAHSATLEAISIESTTINKWIGHTTTQDNILRANYKDEDLQPYSTEFICGLNESEAIGVGYKFSYTHSPLSYENSFTFNPSLYYIFDPEDEQADPYRTYIKIYNFLAFLAGHEPQVQHVSVEYRMHRGTVNASMYFVDRSARPNHKGVYVLLPLGMNLRFNHWGLPALPETVFKRYFSTDSELQDTLQKYNTYRNMSNIEDRALGYFRLLEKHCYKEKSHLDPQQLEEFCAIAKNWMKANGFNRENTKSFIGGINKLNRSKYNTEKCLTDFFKSLPEEITKGERLKEVDIPAICRLRNDITHANHYEVSEDEMYTYTSNIHHLLILALLVKLGINLTDFTELSKHLSTI
jgi:hypothetical protein